MKEYTREDVNKVWPSVGMRCVCIDDAWSDVPCRLAGIVPPTRVPMLNEILTVREVHGILPFSTDEPRHLIFEELEPFAYSASCFRPLAAKTIEDDLAVFHHLLTNLPIYELAAEEAGSNVDRVDGLLLALNACWERYGVEE